MSTNTEMKQWRTLHIAAQILYRIAGNVSIESVSQNERFELLVSILDERERFGVKVANSTYIGSVAHAAYVRHLEQDYAPSKKEFVPILLMCVNEQQETAQIGMLVSWLYNAPKVYEKTKLHAATEKMWPKILDMLNSTYDTIRVVSRNNVNIVRNIEFGLHGQNGELLIANAIYLREVHEGYRIQRRGPQNEEERIESLLSVIRQDEYPTDELDVAVLETFEAKFQNVRVRKSLLLLSSEIRELQREIDRPNTVINIPVLPEYDPIALQMLGNMRLPSISIKVYGMTQRTIDILANISLHRVHKIHDFITYCALIEQLKKTMKKPDDVVLV